MSLLNEILQWSITLPDWQQDAVRRLFQQKDLTQQDYDDLYAMLKAAHGIPDPQHRKPIPLKTEHLPVKVTGGTVVLKTMRDLLHVNRIASGQPLTFSPTGITVIYGGNGSGKSGYSRVLKRACRARDQAEDVLTDATNSADRNAVPEATFDITIGTSNKSVKWKRGAMPPDELSTIAVFDAHCARSYMKEGEAPYLPYGMDIFVNLADKIIPNLSQELKRDINTINIDTNPFNHLLGETAVGKLIANLSCRTNPVEINTLATLSVAEISRIAELNIVLSETDPQTRADEFKRSAERIKDIAIRVNQAHSWVKDETLDKIKINCDAVLVAEEAERTAAYLLQSGESLLPGTGEQIWKAFFEAARKYSTEFAYPGRAFPYTENGAVCPLCQQPLTDGGERLKRFDKYIQDEAAKTATQKRSQLNTIKTKIQQADITIRLNKPLEAELTQLDQTVVTKIIAFEAAIETRHIWMLNAINSCCWDNKPQLSENPEVALRRLAVKQLTTSRTFKKAANGLHKNQLKAEYDELIARQGLKTSLGAVLSMVERMRFKAVLESCKYELDTAPISKESRRLAETVVTPALAKAIDNEFQILGIGYIKTKLAKRSEKGKIQYSLLLDLPTVTKIEAILSEGEQRAIAIGSFLAELQLSGHQGGIVFDDPVSSLDHRWRKRVAGRIVREAAQRQVIVFTHDTVFLCELREQISQQNVDGVIRYLEWENKTPGHVKEGLPWEHQGYNERLSMLKQNQKQIEKDWQVYPNAEQHKKMKQQYDDIRATIERAIQDVVFNDVINRYRDYIQVGKLDKVADNECKEIKRLYSRCNNIISGHDPSSAKNASPPTPAELAQDIAALETVIQAIKDGRKQTTGAKISATP